MGKRANPAVIGGFIVGAVALCIIGVLLFGRLRLLTDKQSFVLYFDSSVDGLNIGAPVDFQGGADRLGYRHQGTICDRQR